MTEENAVPEQTPEQKPTPKKMRRGILDTLPDDVRKELDDYLRTHTAGAAFAMLKQKYTMKFPQLLKLSRTSVYLYTERHNLKAPPPSAEVDQILANITPNEELKAAIVKTTDPNMSMFDKRASLISVCERIKASIDRLTAAQTNFTDPRAEDAITHKERLYVDVIKHLDLMQDKQAQEANSNWLQEALTLEQMFINQAASVYREVHQDKTLLAEFMDKFIIRLEDMMKNYRASKEEFLKNKDKDINKA